MLFNILAPGVIEDHITAGYTRIFNDGAELSFELMHAFHHSVDGANPFDPTQEIRIQMFQLEAGVSYSRRFAGF